MKTLRTMLGKRGAAGFFQDARDFQILFLVSFFCLGVWARDFTIRWDCVLAVILSSLIVQFAADRAFQTPTPSFRSAWITAISLCLLLRANHWTTMVFAGSLSILSKYVFRAGGKHFFNPSNFGIIAILFLFEDGWVTPGQWGEEIWFAMFFVAAGLLVVKKVGRWDTTAVFLLLYTFLEGLRNYWLGWSWDVLAHRLTSGSLLLFSFFMITDPRAIPDHLRGRIVFASLVALLTFILRNYFFIPTAIFWALFVLSPITLLLDRIWTSKRFQWNFQPAIRAGRIHSREVNMVRSILVLLFLSLSAPAWSFCGFYVAKADTKLFNKASKVVLARDGDRTVMTMSNDFQGDVKDFAIVVPVPAVLQKGQVHIGDAKIMDRVDAFSAPRLVEYFDEDPCAPAYVTEAVPDMAQAPAGAMRKGADALGVTIEAQFTVGEYDILILSAKESAGLETWLIQNGYKIPQGARDLLQPYIRQNMKFFVAKVNLKEFEKKGFTFLRPLQMAYESPKFMLPIRLGMANAEAEQDLVAFILSPVGRTEVTNYRTVKIPSNMDIPVFVKNEFGDFYKSMYQRSYEKEGKNAVFLEYAWDMNWCDPCAADPLTPQELRKAGVFWLDQQPSGDNLRPMPGQSNVYLTRLHVRYSRPKFPEDLTFQTTPNRENFQGRYVLRHPFKGEIKCKEGKEYKRNLRRRMEQEAQTLAQLTGWDINNIRKKISFPAQASQQNGDEDSWWESIFGDDEEDEDDEEDR